MDHMETWQDSLECDPRMSMCRAQPKEHGQRGPLITDVSCNVDGGLGTARYERRVLHRRYYFIYRL